MQDYLAEGDRNISISKVIFKARGKTLDIKSPKKLKYDDLQGFMQILFWIFFGGTPILTP